MARADDLAEAAIAAVVDGKPIPRLVEVLDVCANPPSRNIGSMALGACAEAGHLSWDRWDEFMSQPSNERGSSMYSFWEIIAGMLKTASRKAQETTRAELGWRLLTSKPWTTITVITGKNEPVTRKRYPPDRGFKVPHNVAVFASAGNRNIKGHEVEKSDGSISLKGFAPERDGVSLALHYLLGGTISTEVDRHEVTGPGMRAVRRCNWSKFCSFAGVDFIRQLELARNDPRLVIPWLDAVPSGRSYFHLIQYKSGNSVVLMSQSAANTRGPVGIASYDAAFRKLTWVTASYDLGTGARWARIETEVDPLSWSVAYASCFAKERRGAEATAIRVFELPDEEIGFEVLWNNLGAKMVVPGQPSDLPTATPPAGGFNSTLVDDAGSAVDVAIRGSLGDHGWPQEQARASHHVTTLLLRKNFAAAETQCAALLSVLRKGQPV